MSQSCAWGCDMYRSRMACRYGWLLYIKPQNYTRYAIASKVYTCRSTVEMKDHLVFAGISALAFILLTLTLCTTEASIKFYEYIIIIIAN